MGFNEKDLRSLALINLDDRQLKRYHIDQTSRPLESNVIEAAYHILPKLLPPAENDLTSGWVVLHRGSDTGAYLVAYSWVWDNVVEVHSYAAGQPALECPISIRPTSSKSPGRGQAACGSSLCSNTSARRGRDTSCRPKRPTWARTCSTQFPTAPSGCNHRSKSRNLRRRRRFRDWSGLWAPSERGHRLLSR